jgi:hypothetical protein
MVTIVREAELPAHPERVWSVATLPARFEEWLSLHVRWPDVIPTEMAEGSKFRQVVSLLGLPVPMTWTVAESTAPAALELSGEAIAGVRVLIRFDIADAGSGTASTLRVTADLTGALVTGSLQSTVQKFADTQLETSISRLSALM